jgi:hypothetical protein
MSLYYSCQVCNEAADSSGPAVPAAFNEQRTQPLLQHASDYRLSIVRFGLSGRSVPTYRLQVQLAQSDPTQLAYVVALSATADVGAAPLYPAAVLAQTLTVKLWTPQGGLLAWDDAVPAAALYANAAALAVAVQAAIVALGGLFAGITVAANGWGALILTAPAGMLVSAGGPDAASRNMYGFSAQQLAFSAAAAALTAKNAAAIPSSAQWSGTATQRVVYVPEDGTRPRPPAVGPIVSQDNSQGYYDGYSVEWAAGLFNVAYAACLASLNTSFQTWFSAQYPLVPLKTLQSTAPVITFDAATQLFSMTVSAVSTPNAAGARTSAGCVYPSFSEELSVYYDEASSNLFGSWPETTASSAVVGSPYYSQMRFDAAPISAANTCTIRQQVTSLTSFWSPVQTLIIFVGGDLSCRSEFFSSPAAQATGNAFQSNTSASAFGNVLAEVAFQNASALDIGQTQTSFLPYISRPTALTASGPVSNILISCGWRDSFGNLTPIYLLPGASFNCKLAFTRNDIALGSE